MCECVYCGKETAADPAAAGWEPGGWVRQGNVHNWHDGPICAECASKATDWNDGPTMPYAPPVTTCAFCARAERQHNNDANGGRFPYFYAYRHGPVPPGESDLIQINRVACVPCERQRWADFAEHDEPAPVLALEPEELARLTVRPFQASSPVVQPAA